MKCFRKRVVPVIVAILALSICLRAQSTGALVGTVHDTSGAVIPGAKVVATNVLTGIVQSQASNSDGDYSFPSLATGIYKINVAASGFQPLLVEQIEIHVASTVRQDAALSPAAVSTSVEVISSTPLLDTETPEIGQLVEASQITELPLNGRDIYSLLTLTAGAESSASHDSSVGNNGYVSRNRPTIAGERAGYTVFRMDGLNMNTQGLPQAAMAPNVDAVQEFRSITQLGSAADSGTGSVYIDLKSGTNKFHGTAYDFLEKQHSRCRTVLPAEDLNAPGYTYEGRATAIQPVWRHLERTDLEKSHLLHGQLPDSPPALIRPGSGLLPNIQHVGGRLLQCQYRPLYG